MAVEGTRSALPRIYPLRFRRICSVLGLVAKMPDSSLELISSAFVAHFDTASPNDRLGLDVQEELKEYGLSSDSLHGAVQTLARLTVRTGDSVENVLSDLQSTLQRNPGGYPNPERERSYEHFVRLLRTYTLAFASVERTMSRARARRAFAGSLVLGLTMGFSLLLSAGGIADLVNPGLAFPSFVAAVGLAVVSFLLLREQ